MVGYVKLVWICQNACHSNAILIKGAGGAEVKRFHDIHYDPNIIAICKYNDTCQKKKSCANLKYCVIQSYCSSVSSDHHTTILCSVLCFIVLVARLIVHITAQAGTYYPRNTNTVRHRQSN
jgi:hypothetical protein